MKQLRAQMLRMPIDYLEKKYIIKHEDRHVIIIHVPLYAEDKKCQ